MFAVYNEEQITNSTNGNNSDTFRSSFPGNYSLNEDQSTLVQDLNNSALFYLEQDKFVPFIKGILCPFWAFVTLVTNTMVCVVLTSKKMISPTNVLLVAIACSDMLTGFLPVPCMLYFYASERYKDWVPYGWCFAYQCLTDFLPTIFHTTTIWLTVTLAAQRYIYVCRPVRAKLFCTIPNFIKVITGIFVCSFLFHSCRFFENDYVPVNAISRLSSPSPLAYSLSSSSPLLSASSSSSSPLSLPSSSSSSLEYYYDRPSDQRLKPLKSVTTLPSHVISSDDYQPVTKRVVIVVACRKYLKGFINANKQTYFNVYYWSRVVFIHILPCVSLVLLNAALIGALRKASARRRRLLHYGDKKSSDAQMIVRREELVCVLEPRESNYGLAKGAEDRVTAYGRLGPPKSQRTTSEHVLKTQEMSVHIKKSKTQPVEANSEIKNEINCRLISVALTDHSKTANIRSIPASNHGEENADDKLQTKIFPENASHQLGVSGSQRSSKGIVGSAKALSVGKAALKGSKRLRATSTSVAMVAKTKNKQRRQAECNCTTLMLVVVVGLFLLVELPLAAIFVLQIIDNSLELNIINYSSGQIVTWVINMLILVGYSVNFVVYCAMNRDFRSTFRERIVSFVFFCDQNSFPCRTKDDPGDSTKIQVVDHVLPSSRSISGFFHYGKPHSHRHRSFFYMSPKNRSYIKDKMAARPQSAAETFVV